MPPPWGYGQPSFPVPKVERPRDKAILLRQLRDLRQFVQRLCKAGLLKYPNIPINARKGIVGNRIRWTQITQHEIVSEIVKNVIPQSSSCSWVELVGKGRAQTRTYFCSHNWSEPFRDFMLTVEHHAREHRVRPHIAYWICVFANDQWRVDLGVKLTDSPFYEALHGAAMTVVMLDESAEALQRVWVVFEMHETTQGLDQSLEVWTPLGRVGSCMVASGTMVHAIEQLDTAKADASNPCDRRQIMNHIAGVPELTGILRKTDGSKAIDPTLPLESYEAGLIQQNGGKFRDLNKSVQSAVYRSIQYELGTVKSSPRQAQTYFPIDDPVDRGISLAQLRALRQELQGFLGEAHYLSANLHRVREEFLVPRTQGFKCSYVEIVCESSQVPEYHVSVAREAVFDRLMDALEWHAEARDLPDTAVYWIELLASFDESSLGVNDTAKSVRNANGYVLVLDRSNRWMERGMTAFEAYLAIENSKSFDLITATGALSTTRPFPKGTWMFGEFDDEIASQALDFDVTKCTFESDTEAERRYMLNCIANLDVIDGDAVETEKEPEQECVGYDSFNQRFRRKLAGPVLREAAFTGNEAAIKRVMDACPGLILDAAALRGVSGEKALHCAAAAGHLGVVRLLLSLSTDVNTQDLDGETPLHYATLAGQGDMVLLLLKEGADPLRESFTAETAHEVAQDNPAYFLGVEVGRVEHLLRTDMEIEENYRRESAGMMLKSTYRTQDTRDDLGDIATTPGKGEHVQVMKRRLQFAEDEARRLRVENAWLRALVASEDEDGILEAQNKAFDRTTSRVSLGRSTTMPVSTLSPLKSLDRSETFKKELTRSRRQMLAAAFQAHDLQGQGRLTWGQLRSLMIFCTSTPAENSTDSGESEADAMLEAMAQGLGAQGANGCGPEPGEELELDMLLDWLFDDSGA